MEVCLSTCDRFSPDWYGCLFCQRNSDIRSLERCAGKNLEYFLGKGRGGYSVLYILAAKAVGVVVT